MPIPNSEPEHQTAIAGFASTHGPEHALTLSARNILANFLFSSGKEHPHAKQPAALSRQRRP